MASFDSNFSPPNKQNHSFDLNTVPTNSNDFDSQIEDFGYEGDSVRAFEETNPGNGRSIPVTVIASSESTIVIDVNPAEEPNTHVLEVDVHQLYEESESEEHEVGDEGPKEDDNFIGNKKPNLTNSQRWAVYNALLARSVNGKLKRTHTREVSDLLSVHIRTVRRIWERAKTTPAGILVDVSQRRTKRCGRKKVPMDMQRILEIPLHKRTTLRSLSEALGISYSSLYRRVREGLLRRHSNALKPHLNEKNKVARLKFCLSMLDPQSLAQEPKFVDMYNILHINEKWFEMTKKKENYYLLPTEDDPVRTCQSKNFIGKVMFLAAMARPRFDDEGNEIFSGKIGVFPFVTIQPAQRRSRNREAGTMETKPITSVKRDDIRKCLIENVIRIIHERWPAEDAGKIIFIQQDNARMHVLPTDEEFRAAASQNGFDIRLTYQPPNSPDMNILDLGFFSAIQALQHKVCPKNIDELIQAVQNAYEEYSPRKVNHIFLTLQLCMQETMRLEGSNNYKLPHMKKEALEREGRLPNQIICDPTIVENVMNKLAS